MKHIRTYNEGLEDELRRLEGELQQAEETAGVNNQDVADNSRVQNIEKDGRRGKNSLIDEPQKTTALINRISLIRRELSLRDRTREEYKEKYGIADNGDISIENVAKMFHDFNSDKAVGNLFEKVYNVLRSLKNDFRVSDNVSAKDREKDIRPQRLCRHSCAERSS